MKKQLKSLPSFVVKHKWSILPILIILAVKIVLYGLNFTDYPYYENDEATYSIRALAFAKDGSFDLYTYWYDHAPAGWMLIALWYLVTGHAELFGSLLNSSRFFIFLLTTVSTLLVYKITLNILKDRWFALLAAILFMLSPLSIYYQRRVLLDNIMVFWTLLSLLFAFRRPLKLKDSLFSAFAFSMAVLTKLNAIFFAPALIYAIYKHAPKTIRSMSLALWASAAGSVMLLFPLYAILKGEFFSKNPNPETGAFDNGISLLDSLKYQSSRGTGDSLKFWQDGSSFRNALDVWIDKDITLMLFLFAALSLVGLLAFKRTRNSQTRLISLTLAMLGMVLFMIRGGVVLEFYFIPLIPFGVIGTVAIIAAPLRLKQVKSRFVKVFYKVALASCLIVLQMPYVLAHQAFKNNETSNMVQAIEWVRNNVDPDSYIASDNYAVIYLNSNGEFKNLHYNYKYEYDPDIKGLIADDWRNIDYILLTHEVLKQIRVGETPFLKDAFDHSVEVASFTRYTSSYNDIPNYISTNGDWVKIFKVKQDNEIIGQQSWAGFLDNHLMDYGRIVDSKDSQVTTSQYQSNSMVRAVQEGEQQWFDGIWQWTKDHLQNRSQDKLVSSQWSMVDGELALADPNTNGLADLEFAYALYLAADKWDVQTYQDEADAILKDFWQSEVATIAGRLYVLPSKTQTLTNPTTINPSYAALPYMEYFIGANTGYDWQKLIEDSYDMLGRVQNADTGLFPNWVDISANGTVSPATTYAGASATQYGYEAFRIPYWLNAQYATSTRAKELLIPYGLYMAGLYEENQFIPAVIEVDGSEVSTFDDTLMYGAAYAGIRLVDSAAADRVIKDQVVGGGFNPQTGQWAKEGSNAYNQFWLPLLIHDTPSLRLSAITPAEQ